MLTVTKNMKKTTTNSATNAVNKRRIAVGKRSPTVKAKKLTIKEKKFIARKVAGDTNKEAYAAAGYSITQPSTVEVNASKLKNKPHIQQAIDDALALHNLTPEHAIGELAKIVNQDEEMGAKRLAIKDTLELHGWRKGESPDLQLNIKNAFFNASRK